jgi:hypothetical protein
VLFLSHAIGSGVHAIRSRTQYEWVRTISNASNVWSTVLLPRILLSVAAVSRYGVEWVSRDGIKDSEISYSNFG